MEKQEHQQTKKAFDRQPVQYLLIDLTCLTETWQISSLCEALDCLFTTISVMKGSVRIPGIGVGVINSSYASVLPIESTKGSFSRFKAILAELKSLMEKQIEGENRKKKTAYETSIVIALHEATTQFEKYSEYVSTLYDSELQLQLTILSYDNGEKCVQNVENSLADLDVGQVKKVQVVKIGPASVSASESVPSSQQDPYSFTISDSATDVSTISGLIQVTSITGDKDSVDGCLRTSWLRDCNTDLEHLRLVLPDGQLIIKCDVTDSILELGYSQHMALQTDPGYTQTIIANQIKPNQTTQLPIYKLQMINLVQMSGICESVIFGNPVTITPTVCWRMDYDELERNRQYFCQLNVYLKDKNLAAVLMRRNSEARNPANNLKAYYIMLPSESGERMVVVNGATFEQLLPDGSTCEDGPTRSDVMAEISTSMKRLTVDAFYDPLKHSSGLFEYISESFRKNPGTNRRHSLPPARFRIRN